MDIDTLRELCLSFPAATEKVTWGADLTFRVNEKIFAVTVLEPAPVWLSFKCSPETFVELTERAGIIPAPYLARAKWVALQHKEALSGGELAELLRQSYDLVVAGLPKKVREGIANGLPSRAGRGSNTKRNPKKSKRKASRSSRR